MSKIPNATPRGNSDGRDAVNGIKDIIDWEMQLVKDAKAYDLTEDEVTALRAAYIRESMNPLEKLFEKAIDTGVEAISGYKKPVYRSSQEILNAAKTRMQQK